MALRKKGKYWYGDAQLDIRPELVRFSTENGYRAEQFADVVCTCGGVAFQLAMDEAEGAALRYCAACETEHPMGDSEAYLEGAELEDCSCVCGEDTFEVTVGLALYRDSDDVRWLYIGCRCIACGLTGCYGDWKNEYIGYRDLLARV